MFKKRMLLLGAALAAFGAIMASAAIANPTGTDNTPASGSVGVDTPDVEADFANYAGAIPATGAFVHFADVTARNVDPGYLTMSATSVTQVTALSQQTATCGTIGTNVIDGTAGSLAITSAPGGTVVGEVQVSLAATGTNNTCAVGGAVVKVDVTVP